MKTDDQNQADLSVIIPAYRAGGSICRALASVAAQTRKPLEVIVIDDGSDDDTLEVATGMQEKMGPISLKVLTQENAGAGAARNRGLAEARATFVAFLDADDEWLPEKIDQSMSRIEDGEHVLVAHNFTRVEQDGSESIIDCNRRFLQASDPFAALYRQGFIGTSTVVARRQALVQAGGFDETLATAQDFDLWLKALKDPAVRFTIFPDVLTRYHVSANSITTFTARRLACTLCIAERHFPALMERNGKGLMNLWKRIVAVHYEAFSAYRNTGRFIAAPCSVLSLPWHLVRLSVFTTGAANPAPDWLRTLLWVWVIAAFGAYMFRFQHLVQAALNMVARI